MTGPRIRSGVEWLHARCERCGVTWRARGTLASRQAAARAQKHASRTGHRVAVEWANRR